MNRSKTPGITLRALGAECIILRHLSSGAPYLLAQVTGLPVLNAGDGMHEHPSQALLDVRTMLQALGRPEDAPGETLLQGITVAITGDILHSRVARSNALLLPRLGARVILCGPPALLPELALELGPGISIERDFDRALTQAQIVMMLRIQKERLTGCAHRSGRVHGPLSAARQRLRANAPKAHRDAPRPHDPRARDHERGGRRAAVGDRSSKCSNGVAIRMALIASRPGAAASDPAAFVKAAKKKRGGA